MAKSNRRKKQDRDKAAVRRAEQERRRVRAERGRHIERLNDPSVSPADVAGILAAEFQDRVFAANIMRLRMSVGVSAEEISETARLLLEGTVLEGTAPEPLGVGALAVAALAAHLSGDEDAEHDYARELLARADASGDPGQRFAVIDSATGRDHPGETCELIRPYLRGHPDDELAAAIYARALAKAFGQAEPGELETAALERYGDRSGADALDHAVGEFAERTQWGAVIRKWMEEEGTDPGRDRWGAAERDATDALLAEAVLNFPVTSEAAHADEDEDTADTPLRAFAADAEAPTELAAWAAERDQHLRYGIWQLAAPSPSPGVWCTDLVSGTKRYAQFLAEVIDGAPPWSVWLGTLAPTDGIWRATRAGIWLSPVEGDAVAEYAEDAVWHMLNTLMDAPVRQAPPMEQVRFGQAEPYCVRWETGEEPEPEFGVFSSPVLARLAPRLASWVWLKRAERVLLQNTDGEPMVLVDAVVAVDGDVTERLFERSDFGEEEEGEDGELVWWGEPTVDHSDEHIVRARLTPEPGRIRVRVNSQARLKRLLRILKEIGAAPKLTEESRSLPSIDFAWGPVPGDGQTARQWAEDWLGQAVAVLDFHTPRHAAGGGQEERLRLEGLLRQLEYQSALSAARGGRPVDTAWLRAELGLPTTEQDKVA